MPMAGPHPPTPPAIRSQEAHELRQQPVAPGKLYCPGFFFGEATGEFPANGCATRAQNRNKGSPPHNLLFCPRYLTATKRESPGRGAGAKRTEGGVSGGAGNLQSEFHVEGGFAV